MHPIVRYFFAFYLILLAGCQTNTPPDSEQTETATSEGASPNTPHVSPTPSNTGSGASNLTERQYLTLFERTMHATTNRKADLTPSEAAAAKTQLEEAALQLNAIQAPVRLSALNASLGRYIDVQRRLYTALQLSDTNQAAAAKAESEVIYKQMDTELTNFMNEKGVVIPRR